LEIGESLLATGDKLGKHIRGYRRNGADGDPSFQGRVVAQLLGSAFNFEHDPARPLDKHSTGFRENGLTPQPMEELVAKLPLQLYYLLAERRLRYVASRRRAGEISHIRHGQYVAKLAKFHS